MSKKENDIHTYKKITAFMECRRLDGLERQQEIGKRPYQQFLPTLGRGLIALIVCLVFAVLMRVRSRCPVL